MELFHALRNPPREKTELHYVQWMAETKEKIEHVLLKDTEVPHLLQTCFRHLEVKYSISVFSIFTNELLDLLKLHLFKLSTKRKTKSVTSLSSLSIKYLLSSEGYPSSTPTWEQTVPLSLSIFSFTLTSLYKHLSKTKTNKK